MYRDCADDKTKTKILKALAKNTLAKDLEERKIVLEAKACAMAVVECLRGKAPLTSNGLFLRTCTIDCRRFSCACAMG